MLIFLNKVSCVIGIIWGREVRRREVGKGGGR